MAIAVRPSQPGFYMNVSFAVLHLTPLLALYTGASWEGLALCVGSYYLRMFGITAGYHRYFAHRTYKLGRVAQFLLAVLAESSAQKGVLWWASHHRHHHKHSDDPNDVHSPKQSGFWYSHVGWILDNKWDATNYASIPDLTRYPELVFIDRWHLLPPVAYATAIFALFGFHGLVWGFFISTVVLWHGTFTINSLSHVYGRRVYATSDTSRNNWMLALLTMGEGWHNNHHHYQRSCAQGWRWYEVDATYYVLKLAEFAGIARGVGKPPAKVVEATMEAVDRRAARTVSELWEAGRRAGEAFAVRLRAFEVEVGRYMPARADVEAHAERLAADLAAIRDEALARIDACRRAFAPELAALSESAARRFEAKLAEIEAHVWSLAESARAAVAVPTLVPVRA